MIERNRITRAERRREWPPRTHLGPSFSTGMTRQLQQLVQCSREQKGQNLTSDGNYDGSF